MKKCRKCNEVKTLDHFCKNKLKSDGFDIYCNECKKEMSRLPEIKKRNQNYQSKYYQEHREKKIAYAVKHQRENSDVYSQYRKRSCNKKKLFLDNVKTPCVKCDESRIWCIDFHHIDPSTKEFNINNTRWGWDKIKNELGKVVCLCSNCHREFHAFYGTKLVEPVKSLESYLNQDPYSLTINISDKEVAT